MSIFLHSECAQGQSTEVNHDGWVDVDLISWSNQKDKPPYNLTLIRRLSEKSSEPNLQQLMFANLYEGQTIDKIVLDIPHQNNNDSYSRYTLKEIKVISYDINPVNDRNKKTFEKIKLQANEVLTKNKNY